jgi:hypothetical protein
MTPRSIWLPRSMLRTMMPRNNCRELAERYCFFLILINDFIYAAAQYLVAAIYVANYDAAKQSYNLYFLLNVNAAIYVAK